MTSAGMVEQSTTFVYPTGSNSFKYFPMCASKSINCFGRAVDVSNVSVGHGMVP